MAFKKKHAEGDRWTPPSKFELGNVVVEDKEEVPGSMASGTILPIEDPIKKPAVEVESVTRLAEPSTFDFATFRCWGTSSVIGTPFKDKSEVARWNEYIESGYEPESFQHFDKTGTMIVLFKKVK